MQKKLQRIHFIAIGGSVMHNLAIALQQSGHTISGSDDEIVEPSRSALSTYGLLPKQEGWYPEKIDASLDTVIVGMHATIDNPELKKAQELGLRIMSFPEFIFEHSRDKQRIVIAGSHGKTTITAVIVHVLNYYKRQFDYVIGARIKGIDQTVKISDAPIIVIEGDEYLSSCLDPTAKFIRYQHHIGLISGIAWDHANVYPTEESYMQQFEKFADQTPKGGILIYCEQDPLAIIIGKKDRADVQSISYKGHSHTTEKGKVYLTNGKERISIQMFGNHNYQNLSGAKEVLKKIGVSTEQFFQAISSFEGASGRLEKILDHDSITVFKDFAHAPSKVKATVKAVKDMYPERDLLACLELHTFSSLNKKFLPHYKESLKNAQKGVVYFNPEKVKAKKLEPLEIDDIKKVFGSQTDVFTDKEKLREYIVQQPWKNKNLLMMSSGNFGGINIAELAHLLKA